MSTEVRILDVVALTQDLPAQGFLRGQVGTVVEFDPPATWIVEFSDQDGRAFGFARLNTEQLIVLRYTREKVA